VSALRPTAATPIPRFLLLAALLGSASVAHAGSDPLPPSEPIEVVQSHPGITVDIIDRDNRRIPLVDDDPRPSAMDSFAFRDVPGMGAKSALVADALTAAGAAVVQGVMIRNAIQRLEPIQAQLGDFDFQQRFEHALATKLATTLVVVPSGVAWIRTPDELVAARGKERTGVLVMEPRLSFLSSFEDMAVVVETRRVDRVAKNGKVKEKTFDTRAYGYFFLLDKVENSFATDDSRRWVGLGGDKLVAMLDQAIDEVTDMIVYDMTAAGLAEAGTPVKMRDRKSFMIGGMDRFGRPIVPGPGRLWLRKNDRLQSFVEVKAPAAPAE
jgi:hypothetical protein